MFTSKVYSTEQRAGNLIHVHGLLTSSGETCTWYPLARSSSLECSFLWLKTVCSVSERQSTKHKCREKQNYKQHLWGLGRNIGVSVSVVCSIDLSLPLRFDEREQMWKQHSYSLSLPLTVFNLKLRVTVWQTGNLLLVVSLVSLVTLVWLVNSWSKSEFSQVYFFVGHLAIICNRLPADQCGPGSLFFCY